MAVTMTTVVRTDKIRIKPAVLRKIIFLPQLERSTRVLPVAARADENAIYPRIHI
jgi:hypothetical protein